MLASVNETAAADYQCPACRRAPLVARDEGWACAACRTAFPRLGGVPWLFADPAAILGEWRNRTQRYLAEFGVERARVAAELRAPGLPTATRERLQLLERAFREQCELVRELLEPLSLPAAAGVDALAVQQAFRTPLPLAQDLHSYYANLHRDWAWGEAENVATATLARALAGGPHARVLVLGSGAGRLAYDLHRDGLARSTVALDLSPLLAFAAARLAAGGSLVLWEFPLAPRTHLDAAVRRELRAPAPAPPGLEFVLGDAWQAPFAPQSFDLVLTPWLVDVVEIGFGEIAAHVNRLLRVGGRWVNLGSLAMAWRSATERIGPAEVVERVGAAGFELREARDLVVPYMQSPASRHGRIEELFAFAADKRRRAPHDPAAPSEPEWLRDTRLGVPLTPELELGAAATRIQAIVLSLLDGRRSIDELAALLVERQVLGADEAHAAVLGLCRRLHDEHRRLARA